MTASPFDDGKDADALRTIGELGQALGLKPHVLRYWEEQFPMLQPLKRSGGRRYYRSSDVQLVQTINRLVNVEGYTLKGARAAIEQGRAGSSGKGDAGDDRRAGRKGAREDQGSSNPRYLTARDLPASDELADNARTIPSLHRATDRALVDELKAIRSGLAAAIAD